MVVSKIRSLYRDGDDLHRTIVKEIYEVWDSVLERWTLREIRFVYEVPEVSVPSGGPQFSVEQRHGWLVPEAWEFVSEVWLCTRSQVSESTSGVTDDHKTALGE